MMNTYQPAGRTSRLNWMTTMAKLSPILWGILFGLASLIPAPQALAGVIANGDFAATSGDAAQPFTGWQTADFYTPPSVGNPGGNPFAEFSVGGITNGFLDESLLSQTFQLPADASILSFDYFLSREQDGTTPDQLTAPDSFQVTLFDASAASLVPISSGVFDAAFQVDNVLPPGTGSQELFDSEFVSVSEIGAGWRQVMIDVSSLSGQLVTLEFYLAGDDDGFRTTVGVDNVMLTQNPIPEPASIVVWAMLAGAGMVVSGYRRTSSPARRGDPPRATTPDPP